MLSKNVYNLEKLEQIPTRNGYGEGLVDAGAADENVVVLCADLTDSTRSNMFKERFLDRFIEMGIQEQNMMGVAAGLAMAGKVPFVSSYAVFSPGRNWDQLRVSVCYSDANVKIAGAHTGVSVGPDGATHQALEDIAITRVLPGITVIVPCDYNETKKATIAAAKMKGPVYLRFTREKTPVFTTDDTPFEIGKALVLREGADVTITAIGPLVHEALLAAHELEKEKISVEVINSHTVKPLDEETLLKSFTKTGAVVTVEEHQIFAGFGGAIAEFASKNIPVPIEMIGMPDEFGISGEPGELLAHFGMTKKEIKQAVKKVLKRKK
ncbi:transketolase family protein [Patescibacteria group bacterium]|nr:transketolase family protein [Patescibacteria group bacterium]